MTVLCYYPAGSCVEDAVKTVYEGAGDRFLPLCANHLNELQALYAELPVEFTIYNIFIPAVAERFVTSRMGD